MHDFAFIFAGFFVGIVVGLTGVGGGSLMTPILIFFFGVKPYLAVGTDLLFAAFTKMGGTVSLARQRLVPWRVVAPPVRGQHPGGLADTVCAARGRPGRPGRAAGHDQHAGRGPPVDRRSHSVQGGSRQAGLPRSLPDSQLAQALRPRHWALPLLFGAVIGTLVTLTSVGAGAIGVTVLLILYPLLPLPRIVGADIAYAVPLTLVAGLGHASLGSVDWPLLAKLLAGSLPGIWVGSHLMSRTPERLIRSVLSLLLAYAGTKLVLL
jgi:uncharacterized membrane protein YfcA